MIKSLYITLAYICGAISYPVFVDASEGVRSVAVAVLGAITIATLVFLAHSKEAE